MMRIFRNFLSKNSAVAPRTFPTTGLPILPDSEKVEEENWEWYTPTSFYPVRIGDVLGTRYQVLYKLGYGTTSTTWMCRDLSQNKYVCVKSTIYDYKPTSAEREARAYEALSKRGGSSKSLGAVSVRQALDQFELQAGNARYRFIVHEPLGITMASFLEISDGSFPAYFLKLMLERILHALDYIHTAGIIHTDIQASNFLLRIYDKSVLKDMEKEELRNPSPRKITAHSTIFETRDFLAPFTRWFGNGSFPVLCDFGEARMGQEMYEELIQPVAFRAPEVFLELPWRQSVDIWNLGCFVWYLMCGKSIFSRRGAPDELSADRQHIAWMVALLGPPPSELLAAAGPRALDFFNEDGAPICEVPNETLETLLASSLKSANKTETEAECAGFLAFVRRTLKWRAEERASAAELLHDPWFKLKYVRSKK